MFSSIETSLETLAESTEELTYQLIEKSLSLPGVKINRRDFLVHALGDEIEAEDIPDLLKDGPLKSGLIARRKLNKIAIKLCDQNRLNSSIASFASGLPGGLALAATVPLDTLQYFAINLRSAQQVAYLYGYDDFWSGEEVNEEKINNELAMFLGVMFGVVGASQITKLVSSQLTKTLTSNVHQKAILTVVYTPIIHTISRSLSLQITRSSFSQGLSKTVPLLGGFISGGITYSSMTKMNKRLCDTFDEMYAYTDKEAQEDIQRLKRDIPEVFDKEEKNVESDNL